MAANESTQRRLLAYTISEYLLLIGASVGQVYMIRHLFSKRIGYNRVWGSLIGAVVFKMQERSRTDISYVPFSG